MDANEFQQPQIIQIHTSIFVYTWRFDLQGVGQPPPPANRMHIVASKSGNGPTHNLTQNHLWVTIPCSWPFRVVNERMVAAIFTHFTAAWKCMMSENNFHELFAKFRRGALDQELLEKVRSPYADLKATDFRFLKVLQQISLLWSQPFNECNRVIV